MKAPGRGLFMKAEDMSALEFWRRLAERMEVITTGDGFHGVDQLAQVSEALSFAVAVPDLHDVGGRA
jgi:hypothetical protein